MVRDEDFWKNVKKTEGCWLWMKSREKRPGGEYGVSYRNGHKIVAHRHAYIITYGEIPREIYVCHECDNPPCVRPDHLFLGTNSDNQKDSVGKGRAHVARPNKLIRPRGEGHGCAKLTWEQVERIRTMIGVKSSYDTSREFGVHPSTVQRIWSGQKWKNKN